MECNVGKPAKMRHGEQNNKTAVSGQALGFRQLNLREQTTL